MRWTEGKDALIVDTAMASAEAQAVQRGLESRGFHCTRLVVSPVEITHDAIWDKFYTCYNQPPAGERIQKIVDRLAEMGPQTALIGIGRAGALALMARAIEGGTGPTVVDLAGRDFGSDDAYVSDLYAPVLRGLGGIETAIQLHSGPIQLHHTGRTRLVGEHGSHREIAVQQVDMTPGQIAEWAAGHAR